MKYKYTCHICGFGSFGHSTRDIAYFRGWRHLRVHQAASNWWRCLVIHFTIDGRLRESVMPMSQLEIEHQERPNDNFESVNLL